MIVSGSWDKTVKYWDLRQAGQAAATVSCQERVYTMDVRDNLCVVGTADRYINVIDLRNPSKFYKTMQSPLKWQTRVVSCFTDSAGFAIGSIEGRCAIQYVEDKDSRYVGALARQQRLPQSSAPLTPVTQFKLLLQMSPRSGGKQRRQRPRCQRYFVPPRPWHL